MAKRNEKDEKRLDFQAEIRRLRQNGPQRLYLLWGPEDYLREHYLQTLKGICLPEGEDSFSYKRMDGPELDLHDLREAIDALPFMTERSFVELQDVDLNRLKEPEKLLDVLSDIPDYCTVVFVQSASYALDGRTKGVKGLRTLAQELEFTSQSQGDLIRWIARRFAAAGFYHAYTSYVYYRLPVPVSGRVRGFHRGRRRTYFASRLSAYRPAGAQCHCHE